MLPASTAVQRPPDARLLIVEAEGEPTHTKRSRLPEQLRPGDVLIANDAATIPASLPGVHEPTGRTVEVRLAGRRSLAHDDVRAFTSVVFGDGDHRTPTERRAPPPPLHPGDPLRLGPLRAEVTELLGHPRLVRLAFAGAPDDVWAGIGRHGRPIQYAYVEQALSLWDVWTRVAARPVAFEPPSAGFLLDWDLIERLRSQAVDFATVTLAAGISSTGDAELDLRLPFDEAYQIPERTVQAIEGTKRRGGSVIALGTTVTRALEHAAAGGSVPSAGVGLATGRLGPGSEPTVVDAIVTGVHEPSDSHYQLLRAFTSDGALARATQAARSRRYRTHEFGDSMLVWRDAASRLPTGTAGRFEGLAAGRAPSVAVR